MVIINCIQIIKYIFLNCMTPLHPNKSLIFFKGRMYEPSEWIFPFPSWIVVFCFFCILPDFRLELWQSFSVGRMSFEFLPKWRIDQTMDPSLDPFWDWLHPAECWPYQEYFRIYSNNNKRTFLRQFLILHLELMQNFELQLFITFFHSKWNRFKIILDGWVPEIEFF